MEHGEKKLNLKGNDNKLRYYRLQKTDRKEKVTRKVANKETGIKEDQVFEKTVDNRIYFSEDQVRDFSLDNNGLPKIPYDNKNFTQFNNYFFDFWGHFLGAEATILYGHLYRRCIDKDYCWPDLKNISAKMGKGEATVRKYLDVLEDYGFVYRFLVENLDQRKQDSTLYKVRSTVPLLSNDLIEKLPSNLRKEHDAYIKKIGEESNRIVDSFNADVYYNRLIENGRLKENHKQMTFEDLEEVRKYKESKMLKSITEDDMDLLKRVQECLEKVFSKPSMDMWFRKLLLKRNGNAVSVYAPNQLVFSMLNDKHYKDVEAALKLVDKNIEQIDIVLI